MKRLILTMLLLSVMGCGGNGGGTEEEEDECEPFAGIAAICCNCVCKNAESGNHCGEDEYISHRYYLDEDRPDGQYGPGTTCVDLCDGICSLWSSSSVDRVCVADGVHEDFWEECDGGPWIDPPRPCDDWDPPYDGGM
ncbi:MAG: hypothetical protein GY854_19925 [Deltaproteobacteria bacterium]|nr:hypothetical protein [Deltaproteobacteria bacterium]